MLLVLAIPACRALSGVLPLPPLCTARPQALSTACDPSSQVLSVNIPSKHGCLQNRAQLVLAPPDTVPDEAFVTRVFRHYKAYSHYAHSRSAPNSVASLAAKAMDLGMVLGGKHVTAWDSKLQGWRVVGGRVPRRVIPAETPQRCAHILSPASTRPPASSVPTRVYALRPRLPGTPLPQVDSKGLLGLLRGPHRHPGLDLAVGSEVGSRGKEGAWP